MNTQRHRLSFIWDIKDNGVQRLHCLDTFQPGDKQTCLKKNEIK